MNENLEKLERESADRRRSDIVDNGYWKWFVGFAVVFSISDFYLAINRFYFARQNRELINAFCVCMAFLMPWIATAGTYRQLRARLFASNAENLIPFVRYSSAVDLMVTFMAFQLIVIVALVTR